VTDDERPPFDLARIVEVFNRHGVVYIAIGGVSGMLHGAVYYVTQDVDLMVQSNLDNLTRIVAALVELGADIDHDLIAEDLLANTQWQTRRPGPTTASTPSTPTPRTRAIAGLCHELTVTGTSYPGTTLTLIYTVKTDR
jgi:hypothetical protein